MFEHPVTAEQNGAHGRVVGQRREDDLRRLRAVGRAGGLARALLDELAAARVATRRDDERVAGCQDEACERSPHPARADPAYDRAFGGRVVLLSWPTYLAVARRPAVPRRRASSSGPLIRDQRQKGESSDGDLPVLGGHLEQRQDVQDQREEEGGENCTDERSSSSGKACSAEHRRDDALERVPADEWATRSGSGRRRRSPATAAISEHITNARKTTRPVFVPRRRAEVSSRPTARTDRPAAAAVEPESQATARTTTPMNAIGMKPMLVVIA